MIRSSDQFKNIIDLTIYIVVSCLIVILPIVYVSNESVLCTEIACGHYMPKIFALRAAGTVVGILILMSCKGFMSHFCHFFQNIFQILLYT